MTDATPRFEQAPAPSGRSVRLLGEWTAGQFARAGCAATGWRAPCRPPGSRPGTCAMRPCWTTWAPSCCGTTGADAGPSSSNCCRRSARSWSGWRSSRSRRPPRQRADAAWTLFLAFGAGMLRAAGQLGLRAAARPAHAGPARAGAGAAPGALARFLRPPVPHRRHRAADHGAGGRPDRRGAGLPHLAAAAPVRRRRVHRRHPGHRAGARAGADAGAPS